MSVRRKKIVAISIVVVVFLGLLVIVLRGSPANYWITPGELKSQSGAAGQFVRVAGQVVSNSMEWDRANNQMLFKIKSDGEKAVLPVVYRGFMPNSFVNESRVIVEGSMSADKFNAQALLVRCPENYMAEKAVGGLFKALKIEGQLYQ